MNALIGQSLRFVFRGAINCNACGKKTRKSYSQGYCYRCAQTLPQCDSCIMSPEKCHYHAGSCRDSGWGEKYCFQDHYVYLANSSGIKIGITRGSQIPTRWMDQGAIQAKPVARVKNRLMSGKVEDAFKAILPDKTNWRNLLKGDAEPLDLNQLWAEAKDELSVKIAGLIAEVEAEVQHKLDNNGDFNAIEFHADIEWLDDSDIVDIQYPVTQYPEKVTSRSLDSELENSYRALYEPLFFQQLQQTVSAVGINAKTEKAAQKLFTSTIKKGLKKAFTVKPALEAVTAVIKKFPELAALDKAEIEQQFTAALSGSGEMLGVVEGKLNGIKGQYLILDSGVINMRKFTAYHLDFYAE
nr:DUF2797 domain-containing protein [Sinobacterium norvegicum]